MWLGWGQDKHEGIVTVDVFNHDLPVHLSEIFTSPAVTHPGCLARGPTDSIKPDSKVHGSCRITVEQAHCEAPADERARKELDMAGDGRHTLEGCNEGVAVDGDQIRVEKCPTHPIRYRSTRAGGGIEGDDERDRHERPHGELRAVLLCALQLTGAVPVGSPEAVASDRLPALLKVVEIVPEAGAAVLENPVLEGIV